MISKTPQFSPTHLQPSDLFSYHAATLAVHQKIIKFFCESDFPKHGMPCTNHDITGLQKGCASRSVNKFSFM
jgi:hypothetical protein